MDRELTKAQHYRDQANQMRDSAATEDDADARQALILLTEMYDRLCRNYMVRALGPRF
jgi:hypothetical protein